MSRFQFELATADDDAELRQILRQTPMGGQIRLTFCREPSFFDAAVVDGPNPQVGVCRDTQKNRLVGLGIRSVRRRFVNGQPHTVGYLSSLRLASEYRSRGLVARGYRFLRQLHDASPADCYLTTIAEGNDTAIKVLTSGRAGLPDYYDAGRYYTVAIPLRSGSRYRVDGVTFSSATPDDREELMSFFQREGSRRQFFPSYETSDIFEPRCTFRDLSPSHLLLARRQTRLIGTLAAWDQTQFKQTIVTRYASPLRWCRPVVNAWGRLTGAPHLPPPGNTLRYLTAALPVVENDNPDVFAALVSELLRRSVEAGTEFLMLGSHERDPLRPVLQRFRPRWFTTRLYVVCWEDGESFRKQIDSRVPYLELGCL